MAVWKQEDKYGTSGPGRHALGMWLTYRKLASSGYTPGPRARARLAGKLPFWYVIPFTLAARQTLEFRITTGKRFYLLAITANSSQAAGFKAQLYDASRKQRFSDRGVNFGNLCGRAAQPFLYRRPYAFEPITPLLARIQNQATAANSGQIVLYGVSD